MYSCFFTGKELDYDAILRFQACLAQFSRLENDMSDDNCPMIFDSWNCWNQSKPGTVQEQPCPNFPHLGFSSSRKLLEKSSNKKNRLIPTYLN